MSSGTDGAVALLKAAHAQGLEICFANPGTTELTLVRALAEVPGIRPVLGLFEGVCTGAADGYARVTGRPALTLLHLGPGFANGIANLHNARRARSPIVNLVGDHATWHLPFDAPLTSDIDSLARPVGDVLRMADPARIAEDVAAAVAAAANGRIVTMVVPTDIMDAVAVTAGADASPSRPAPPQISRARLDAAEAALRTGGAVLLLGGEALHPAGQQAAMRIAAATGARLLMETYPAIVDLGGDLPRLERLAYFPDDVTRQLGDVHVVLAGARPPVSYFGYEGHPSQLVAAERLVELAAPGEEPARALAALADRLAASGSDGVAAGAREVADVPDEGALTPATVVALLVARLPEGAIVSLEGSSMGGPYLRAAHRARRHRVMTNTGGAIGQGLPCAVGAALGTPGTRVVGLQSDGSAQYTLQALWTMAREALDVTVIIGANHRYAILQTELRRANAGAGPVLDRLTMLDGPRIDWTALAKGYGVAAVRAATAAEFDTALERSFATSGPMLIEAALP